MSRSLAIVLLLFSSESAAWGYRPFIATDAAVADPKEMEIELGYFNLERDRGKNTFIIPKVVLNYGVIRNLEVVSEFGIAEPPHTVQFGLRNLRYRWKQCLEREFSKKSPESALPSRRGLSYPQLVERSKRLDLKEWG